MRAIGIPVEMFTVIFAIGRIRGWIANYREVSEKRSRTDLSSAADLHRRAACIVRTHRSSRKGVRGAREALRLALLGPTGAFSHPKLRPLPW